MPSLVRNVTSVSVEDRDAVVGLREVSCVRLPRVPGWLTGEPPAAQGLESRLPNLPDLPFPTVEESQSVLRVSFPSAETVRLRVARPGSRVHTDDGTGLGIVVDPEPGPLTPAVEERPDCLVLRAGRVEVLVTRFPFSLVVTDTRTGRVVLRTADRLRQAAGFPMAPAVLAGERGDDTLPPEAGTRTLHLELGADEHVTGFGEQFGPVVKNGQRLVLRSEDALGTGTGQAYKPVPVWHSSAGHTGFLNTGAVVTADVGHTRPSVLGLEVADDALDLYLVVGEDAKERLTAYTALTGRPGVPPLWAFGLWMGRCRYHSRAEMEGVADDMDAHDIPCDVLHLDPDWLVTDRLNCDFVWNEARFGPRDEFVSALRERGLRLSLWELPYLDPASPRYAEAHDKGYLVRRPSGELATVEKTPTPDGRPRALVDLTDPDARAWWQGMHDEFLDDGVAVFKTDFGEGCPDGVDLADGTPPNHAHNLYPLRYNAAVSEAVARHSGAPSFVWGRSGWAGSQRYPGQWGGDAESTVAGMQATLRGGLSYALSAPGFWSHDIGGFYGPELTPELYVRWVQMGALSPLARAHGLGPREPWAFGEEALAHAREWIRLRYSLVPYLWQVAHESTVHGWPMMRPLACEFPDDPVATRVDDQFLLGADVLVVPVFDDGAGPVRRRYYLPAGSWVDLRTGECAPGPGVVDREVSLADMPVLVRAGAVVPRVTVDEHVRGTDDLVGRPWTLHLYGMETPSTVSLVGLDGTRTDLQVRDGRVSARGTQPVEPDIVLHAESRRT